MPISTLQSGSFPSNVAIDTDTLVVDGVNNRVGVGTTSTVAQSKMTIAGNSLSITGYDNGFTSGGNRAMIDFGANYMRLGGLTGGGSTVNGIKFITPAGGDAAILDSDGLKFNGDTAAANALDDYEEGNWNPIIGGSSGESGQSYSAQEGAYTKIGNRVHATCYVVLSAKGTISGTYLWIKNLPFTSNASYYGSGNASYWTSLAAGWTSIGLYPDKGTNYCYVVGTGSAQASISYMSPADISNGSGFVLSVTYSV